MLRKDALTQMRKLTFIIIISVMLLAIPINSAYAASVFTIGSTQYVDDQQVIQMDVAPYIKDNRTFLPVRFVANALGVPDFDILYNPASQRVILIKGNSIIQLTIGNNLMLVNGATITMDVAPEITAGRTCLPIAWIAQAFGTSVTWDATTQTITLGDNSSSQQTTTTSSPISQPSSSVVPSLQYDNIQTVSQDFEWQYNGTDYTWQVEVPGDLINWDRQINNITQQFYSSSGLMQNQILNSEPDNIQDLILSDSINENSNFTPWVNETTNSQWTGYIANDLAASAQSAGYDYFHEAEFILSFIGSAIPYNLTTCPELPAQTLVDSGDCKDKSILYASILKSLGYKVALLYFPDVSGTVGHVAVGVAFDDSQIPQDRSLAYYLHNGSKYYFAETTASGWTIGAASVNEPAYVYDVN